MQRRHDGTSIRSKSVYDRRAVMRDDGDGNSAYDSMEHDMAVQMCKLAVSAMPTLSHQERRTCEEECDRMLCDTIAVLAKYNGSMDAMDWERIGSRDQIAVYKRLGSSDDTAPVRLEGTGYIHGKLEDVTSALYCETDDTLISGEAILSGMPVADGAVLELFEHRGPHTPFRFAGVKWHANTSHDLLTYERMGVTLDSDNTEVAYHVVYAITGRGEWPQASQLRASSGNLNRKRAAPLGLKRLEPFALCYVFRRVAEDLVLCFIVGEYWGKQSLRSQRDVEQVLANRVLMVSNVLACHEAKVLTQMVEDCEDTPVQMSKICLRCRMARRTVYDTLKVCGICRKSVCQSCRVMKLICHLDEHTRLADSEAFCTKCLSRVDITLTPTSIPALPSEKRGMGRLDSTPTNVPEQTRSQDRVRSDKPLKECCLKRHVSIPLPKHVYKLPKHAYNYDELIRKRGSGGSETSESSISSSGDTRPEKRREARRECTIVLASEKMNASEMSRSDDLYLNGSNAASGEAERQFHRYLERRRTLDLDSIRTPRRGKDSDHPRDQHLTQAPPSPVFHNLRDPRMAPPSPQADVAHEPVYSRATSRGPSVDKKPEKKATKRDFYRDLYTEL